jgi:hypothetical protein
MFCWGCAIKFLFFLPKSIFVVRDCLYSFLYTVKKAASIPNKKLEAENRKIQDNPVFLFRKNVSQCRYPSQDRL